MENNFELVIERTNPPRPDRPNTLITSFILRRVSPENSSNLNSRSEKTRRERKGESPSFEVYSRSAAPYITYPGMSDFPSFRAFSFY